MFQNLRKQYFLIALKNNGKPPIINRSVSLPLFLKRIRIYSLPVVIMI